MSSVVRGNSTIYAINGFSVQYDERLTTIFVLIKLIAGVFVCSPIVFNFIR